MILTKVTTSSAPLLQVIDPFSSDSMGGNSAPPTAARFNIPGDARVNKLEDVDARFLAFEIMLFLLNLVSLQYHIIVVLTSALGHLRKMNNITRYIIYDLGATPPYSQL
jgi:hypothetical protein